MSLKDDVLLSLTKSGNFVSGQTLANRLGVSRSAVWKAVGQLSSDGYEIEAVTNKGYRLVSGTDEITESEIRRHLALFPDIPIHFYDTLDSTNKKAKLFASDGAPHGTLVVCETQSAGRGRLGRSFYSPRGSGIYMTIIIRPKALLENAPLITTAASVAVAKGVRELCGRDAVIKWVNDVYISGKKICGILTEAVTDVETGTVESAVVGIGINFYPNSFPEELKDAASSVFEEKAPVTRSELIAYITDEFLRIISRLPDSSYMDTYRKLSMVIGQRVVCTRGGAKFEGLVLDVDSLGGLVIDTGGRVETLRSGEISLRLKN